MTQDGATTTNKPVIAQRIVDPAGKIFLGILVAKPTIDLTYAYSIYVMGIKISVLHLTGVFVLLYFAALLLRHQGMQLYRARLFTFFIFANFVSICVGLLYSPPTALIKYLDPSIRILDSFFVFLAASLLTVKYKYEDFTPFIKSAAIGVGIAAVINFVAIELGYGGPKVGALGSLNELRNRGLYYDPGVLSNVALNGIVFCVAWMSMKKPVNIGRVLLCVSIIIVDFYLIYLGLSRTVMILVPIFFLIYFGFYLRSWARIYVPVVLSVLVLLGTVFVTVNLDRIMVRFESDIEVFAQAFQEGSVRPYGGVLDVNLDFDSEIFLGVWEQIGNNRFRNWAYALNDVRQRSGVEIMFGNFRGTVSHSDYLDVLGRNGIVGLCLYLGMLLFYLWTTFSSMRRSKQDNERLIHLLAFSMLVLYMLYAIPFRPLMDTTSSWYMWIVLGFSVGVRFRLRRTAKELMARRRGVHGSAAA